VIHVNSLLDSLPALEAQLEEAETQARDARVRADALRKIIEGVHALNGQAATVTLRVTAVAADVAAVHEPSTPEHPVGRDAIRAIVGERPGIWTISDLVAELKSRGWFTTRKSVEIAAQRLCRLNGEARRVRTGVYMFPASYSETEALPIEEADAA
jgi:hypothetical protein